MSRYALNAYGSDVYGAAPDALYATTMVALPGSDRNPASPQRNQFNTITVQWGDPPGTWDLLRLVRSRTGVPTDEQDGTILVQDALARSFIDAGLPGGAEHYYALYVRTTSGGSRQWVRSATASAISVRDAGYGDLLLDRLPRVHTSADGSATGSPDRTSALASFLNLIGFKFSEYRCLLDNLLYVNDPDRTPGVLLPSLGQQLGYTYEPEIGMRQNRVLFRNAALLAKVKGTQRGIAGFVSSVTGYGASLNGLRNLLHDDNDSNASSATGRWVATGGALTRDTTVATPTDNTYTSAAGSFLLTASGTTASVALYASDPVNLGIPVTGGTTYALSVYLRSSATSRTPNLQISWYTAAGALISTASVAASATSTSAWARSSTTASAPTNAVFATLAISYPTTVSGEVQYFKAVQFEPTSLSAYAPARQLNIVLQANRVNEVTNPSFESNKTGWTATGASVARSTAKFHDSGTASGLVTPTGTSSVVSTTIAVDPSKPFAASGYVTTGGTTGTVAVQLTFYNASSTVVGTATGSAATINGSAWTRVLLLTSTPATAVTATLSFNISAANGDSIYVDHVLAEHADRLLDYFDISNSAAGVVYEGTVGASRAHFYSALSARQSRLLALLPDYLPVGATFRLLLAQPRS